MMLSRVSYFSRSVTADDPQASPAAQFEALSFGAEGFRRICLAELSNDGMEQRKKSLQRELLGMEFLEGSYLKLEELRGRITGDYLWKEARGELGAIPAVDDSCGNPKP